MNLKEYKEFIDHEMLIILGQMDKPSQIFDYLYLGTEWNASNWDELRTNKFDFLLLQFTVIVWSSVFLLIFCSASN